MPAIPVRMVEFVKSMLTTTHVNVQREHHSQTVTIFWSVQVTPAKTMEHVMNMSMVLSVHVCMELQDHTVMVNILSFTLLK